MRMLMQARHGLAKKSSVFTFKKKTWFKFTHGAQFQKMATATTANPFEDAVASYVRYIQQPQL